MSTIKTDTLSNQAGSKTVPVDTVVAGSAKAWVNFNGQGVVAIRGSFNVSSITDNGTGNYTVNFLEAMPDANYSVAGIADVSSTTSISGISFYPASTPTTNEFRVYVAQVASSSFAASDRIHITLSIFGN